MVEASVDAALKQARGVRERGCGYMSKLPANTQPKQVWAKQHSGGH